MSALAQFTAGLTYELDPFQKLACECLEAGSSVLVAAPTGAGKTKVAEFAVALARQEHDLDVVYTAPIKALSNQKYAELCEQYGTDQVGLLTGDVTVNPDAPIRVMTTEVLRNIIYADPDRLSRTHSVVLDEVHFLGDRERGPVWEEIILHLPPQIKIVGLSATVSNAEELGDWMHMVRGDTEVIISEQRPVPLYQHVLTREQLLPMHVRGEFNSQLYALQPQRRRSRGAAPRRGATARLRHTEVVHALAETGLTPAIYFIFSRNGCDQAVSQCLFDGVSLTSVRERTEIKELAAPIVQQLSAGERQALRINTWLRGLERGLAAHHAGLLPQQKQLVEQLFQRRLVKVVFATETLALGINMPAKAVVIEKLKKFNGDDSVYLSSGEFTQLTGRAGRRGIDPEGHAIVLWQQGLDIEILEGLSSARTYPVLSTFVPTYNMAVNLLQSRQVALVRDVLQRSFAQFQADRSLTGEAMQLQQLQQSLDGYREAITRATDKNERRRWEVRYRRLAKQARAVARQLEQRSGNISSIFERVITLLNELGYLAVPQNPAASVAAAAANAKIMPAAVSYSQQLVAATAALPVLRPTVWGLALARLHGDKALLAAQCLRLQLWQGLNPAELAALAGALTYTPRRNDASDAINLSPALRQALSATLRVFEELHVLETAFKLPATELPHSYNAWVIKAWAEKMPLDEILGRSQIVVGDLLRWIKQTSDFLGQLAAAVQTVLDCDEQAETLGVEPLTATQRVQLVTLLNDFRRARTALSYGLAES